MISVDVSPVGESAVMRAPHGSRVLKEVIDAGLRLFLAGHGFARRRSTFSRRRANLTEHVVLSVRTDRVIMRRVFWLVAEAEVNGLEAAALLQVDYQAWNYDHGLLGDPTTFLDPGDFAVGLAETLTRRVLPKLDALHEPFAVPRALERQGHFAAAIEAWRRHGDEDHARRLGEWLTEQPPF